MESEHKMTITTKRKEIIIRVKLEGSSSLDLNEIENVLREKFPDMDFNVDFSTSPKRQKCIGCQFDEPGQKAHMEYGGCLYASSED